MPRSEASTCSDKYEPRAGKKRKTEKGRARVAWRLGNDSSGDRSRRGRRRLRDGKKRARENELRRRVTLLPLDSLVSNRDAISRRRSTPRAPNQREKVQRAGSTRGPERIKTREDLINKREPSIKVVPPPPADSSSGARVACVSHRGTENNERTNNGPWHALLQLLFWEKYCGEVGKESFFSELVISTLMTAAEKNSPRRSPFLPPQLHCY